MGVLRNTKTLVSGRINSSNFNPSRLKREQTWVTKKGVDKTVGAVKGSRPPGRNNWIKRR